MYYGWQLLSRGGAANAPSCPPLNVPLVVEDVRHWVSEAHSFGANDWDGNSHVLAIKGGIPIEIVPKMPLHFTPMSIVVCVKYCVITILYVYL